MRLLVAACLSLSIFSCFAAKGGKSGGGWAPSPTNSVTGHASGRAGNTSTRMDMFDPRKAPPLAPNRKVTPVDCSRPIVMDGGNISCK